MVGDCSADRPRGFAACGYCADVPRHPFLTLSAVCALSASAIVGCSDDSGGNDASTVPSTVPNTGPLEMPADGNDLLQPDAGAALMALRFPQSWVVVPTEQVVGATVQYSRGESSTYTTFSTVYAIDGADPQAELERWRVSMSEALGIKVDAMSGHVSSDTGEGWMVSSVGDAQPGEPELEIEVIRLADTSRPLMVEITYKTVDRKFPVPVFPASVDPALPTVDDCNVRRIDIDLDAAVDVTSAAATPVYRLWWEGECPGTTWDLAVAWATAHGLPVDGATTGFGNQFTTEDGTVVELNVSKLDSGAVFLSMVTEQPMG